LTYDLKNISHFGKFELPLFVVICSAGGTARFSVASIIFTSFNCSTRVRTMIRGCCPYLIRRAVT